jgi:cytochrome P450
MKLHNDSANTSNTCPFAGHTEAPILSSQVASIARSNWSPGPAQKGLGWTWLHKMKKDPLGTFRRLKDEYGDVVYLRIWPEHSVQLTDPGLVRELLIHHHDSITRRKRAVEVFAHVHGHSVITAEGASWQAKRHALQPLFSSRAADVLLPAMVRTLELAFARWPTRSEAQWPIESQLTHLALDVILRTLFSAEAYSDVSRMRARNIEVALQTVGRAGNRAFYYPFDLPDWLPWNWRFANAKRYLDRVIREHIRQRVARPEHEWPDDILTHLPQVTDETGHRWTIQNVRDECMTLFLAGHETTAATLTWWAWCMAKHPDAQSRARQEVHDQLQGRPPTAANLEQLGWLGQTLQESMRIYPAAPILITRCATAPIRLGSWLFPKGTLFHIPVHLMQMDPRSHDEPTSFRPERFDKNKERMPRGSFMPFGAGPRVCLGQQLAQRESLLVAALLLQRFRLELCEGIPEPSPELNVTLRPKTPLRLKLVPL